MIYVYFIEPDTSFQIMWNALMGLVVIWTALNYTYAIWKAYLVATISKRV